MTERLRSNRCPHHDHRSVHRFALAIGQFATKPARLDRTSSPISWPRHIRGCSTDENIYFFVISIHIYHIVYVLLYIYIYFVPHNIPVLHSPTQFRWIIDFSYSDSRLHSLPIYLGHSVPFRSVADRQHYDPADRFWLQRPYFVFDLFSGGLLAPTLCWPTILHRTAALLYGLPNLWITYRVIV